MGLNQANPIYATEPVMHDGEAFMPGEEITGADENDIAAILSAGRGTQDEKAAKTAKQNYQTAQKAAAEAAAANAEAANSALVAAIAPALAAAIASATAQQKPV